MILGVKQLRYMGKLKTKQQMRDTYFIAGDLRIEHW
jgi:hypothetical protein